MSSKYSIFAKGIRAGLAGVNAHTLTVALSRADQLGVDFDVLTEQRAALLLLEQNSYPESEDELKLFLEVGQALTPAALLDATLTDEHAVAYMFWLPPFLVSTETHVQKNASVLLQWCIANRQTAIAANQASLEGLRQMANDPHVSRKQAALLAYVLGRCGTPEDADTVIRLAEYGIEHGRESIALVSEAIYSLNPEGLISALKFFLNSSDEKQFATGLQVLEHITEIDMPDFWSTYYKDIDHITKRLSKLSSKHRSIGRILDAVEKNLSMVP